MKISLSILQINIYQKFKNKSMDDTQALLELPPFSNSIEMNKQEDPLFQNDFLTIAKAMIAYLGPHIAEFKKQKIDDSLEMAFCKMKNLQKDRLFGEYKKMICQKQVGWEYRGEGESYIDGLKKDGKMLQISMLLEFIRQTFCSIFQIILNLQASQESDYQTDIDFLQQQVEQAKQAIAYFENTFILKYSNPAQLSKDLPPHRYQSLIDMKNNYYSYEQLQEILKLLQLKKNMEENFEFFRYPVLGVIPHYLRQLCKNKKHEADKETTEEQLTNLIRKQFEEIDDKVEEEQCKDLLVRNSRDQRISRRDMRELMYELF